MRHSSVPWRLFHRAFKHPEGAHLQVARGINHKALQALGEVGLGHLWSSMVIIYYRFLVYLHDSMIYIYMTYIGHVAGPALSHVGKDPNLQTNMAPERSWPSPRYATTA